MIHVAPGTFSDEMPGGKLHQENAPLIRTVAAGEAIYSEGYAGNACIYVIAEGRIEISTRSDDKRVVLAILGKDECFGETALLPAEPRGSTARALSFCRLIVIDPKTLESELERVSPLLRHVMRSLIRRNKRADDLLLTNANADLFSGIVCYAHVLGLMAQAQSRGMEGEEASIPFGEVFRRCQAITGHPRMHVMAMLKRMETLNLIAFETAHEDSLDLAGFSALDDEARRQVVVFNPARIVDSAQRVADQGLGMSIVSELESTGLSTADALIGIEKQLLLDRMSRGEKRGRASAAESAPESTTKSTTAVASLADLESIDDRTLFDTVSAFAVGDLARMLLSGIDQAVSERLVSVMTKARQIEVSRVIRSNPAIDPTETEDIHRRFIQLLKSIKSGAKVPPTRLSI